MKAIKEVHRNIDDLNAFMDKLLLDDKLTLIDKNFIIYFTNNITKYTRSIQLENEKLNKAIMKKDKEMKTYKRKYEELKNVRSKR